MSRIYRNSRAGALPATRGSSSRTVVTGSVAPVQPLRMTTTPPSTTLLTKPKIRFPWTFRKKRRVTIMNSSWRNDSRQPNQLPMSSIPERNDMSTMMSLDTSAAESDSRMMSCRSNFTNASFHSPPDTTITFVRPNPFPRQPESMYYVPPPNFLPEFQVISESSGMDRPSPWTIRLAVIHFLIALGILLLTATSSCVIPSTPDMQTTLSVNNSVPFNTLSSHLSTPVIKELPKWIDTTTTTMKYAPNTLLQNYDSKSPSIESTAATLVIAAMHVWKHTAPSLSANTIPTGFGNESSSNGVEIPPRHTKVQIDEESIWQTGKASEGLKDMVDNLSTESQQYDEGTYIIPPLDKMNESNDLLDPHNSYRQRQEHNMGKTTKSLSRKTLDQPDLQAWMPFCNASMVFALLISIVAAWTAPHDESYKSKRHKNSFDRKNGT